MQALDAEIECGLGKLRRQHISTLSTFAEYSQRARTIQEAVKHYQEEQVQRQLSLVRQAMQALQNGSTSIPSIATMPVIKSQPPAVVTATTTSTAATTSTPVKPQPPLTANPLLPSPSAPSPRAMTSKTKSLFSTNVRRVAPPTPRGPTPPQTPVRGPNAKGTVISGINLAALTSLPPPSLVVEVPDDEVDSMIIDTRTLYDHHK